VELLSNEIEAENNIKHDDLDDYDSEDIAYLCVFKLEKFIEDNGHLKNNNVLMEKPTYH